MKAQSKLSRYKIFIKRNVVGYLKSLTYNRLLGRIKGPRVLLNSIPKAGTNLADNLLLNLPYIRFGGGRTIRKMSHSNDQVLKSVSIIKKGQYRTAHLEYSKELADVLDTNGIRQVLIIRDPRQLILSHLNYVTYIDTNHKTHWYFKNLSSNEERVSAIIKGVPTIVEPLTEVYENYSKWKTDSNTLFIRFEDLVGQKGGGSEQLQNETVRRIIDHIGLELSQNKIDTLSKRIFNPKSPTFRNPKIDTWKTELSKETKQIIKNSLLCDWLIHFGYEKDNNW